MPIKVQCACGKAFAAKDELAGKTVKCPNCQQPLKIPGGGGAAAKAPAKAGAAAPAAAKSAAAKPAASKAAAPPRPAPAAPASAPPSGDSLFDEIGLQAAVVGTKPCPGCTKPMPIEAVVCVNCGYNAKLGRRMETVKSGGGGPVGHGVVAQDLMDRAAQTIDEDAAEEIKKTGEGMPWWVYLIILSMLVGFGAVMLLMPLKTAMMIGGVMLYCTAAVASLYAFVRLIILAFQESVVQGLLFLFVPLYPLVYIFTRWDKCGSYFLMQLGAGVIGAIGMGAMAISASIEIKPDAEKAFLYRRAVLIASADASWHSPRLMAKEKAGMGHG